MTKNLWLWASLSIVMSVVGLDHRGEVSSWYGGSSVAQAEAITFFFAEESTGVPVEKTAWELVDGNTTTLNLWATTDFTKAKSTVFRVELLVDYAYAGIDIGDLNIHPQAVNEGVWYDAFLNDISWRIYTTDNHKSNWYGYSFGNGEALPADIYHIGQIQLSVANGKTVSSGDVFTLSLSPQTEVLLNDEPMAVSMPQTVVTVQRSNSMEVPEPGTWAMLVGVALVGGAWIRRRKNTVSR